MMAKMADYALLYRRKFKWSVIPSTATKEKNPLVKWYKYQTELPTEEEIREWWTKFPDANIALVTGKVSGVVVWDVDGKKAVEYISDKVMDYTLKAQSSSPDRLHYYYKYPIFKDNREIRCKNLRSSYLKIPLEYKGIGGLVTLPPSLHYSGARYKFVTPISTRLAEMDIWQLEMCFLKRKTTYTSTSDYIPDWAERYISFGAEEGERDNAAYGLAKMYARKGFDFYNVLENLKAWNRTKNRPPLSDRQIEKCVKSGFQKGG